MAYKYKHFIPQNTAPHGAKSIGVYDSDNNKVAEIPLGRLTPPKDKPLYSFGLLSDIHMTGDSNVGTTLKDSNGYITDGYYFRKALEFFNNSECNFVGVSGDMTDIGLFMYTDEGKKSDYYWYYPNQFEEYKAICDLFPNMPVYSCCGNHESYVKDIANMVDDKWENPKLNNNQWIAKPEPWTKIDSQAKLRYYTKTPLYYTISAENTSATSNVEGIDVIENYGNIKLPLDATVLSQTNDVFIMFGQASPTANATWDLDWLEATLEANKNKRCFVFEHLTLASDSGNPENVHNAYWYGFETRLVNLLSKYNAILFHGHSHMQFQEQEKVSYSNFSTNRGFKSIHIPSTSYTRKMVDKNNNGVWESGEKENIGDGAQGYICDVYKDCIMLRGYDFQTNKFIPLGIYRIET